MAFKTGFVLGAAAGYVLGARAGRERYEQIKNWMGGMAQSDRVQTFTDKGKAVADLTAERVRDTMGDALSNAADGVRDVVDKVTGED
jgi:hypothetical protein